MSKKQIIKRYEQLLQDVETDDFYTKIDLANRVNCYKCPTCGHITKTKDVDPGVTPFMHRCEQCAGMAQSTMYNDIAPHKEPTQEWYRPTLAQVLKMDYGLRDHVLRGGLDVRKIKKP